MVSVRVNGKSELKDATFVEELAYEITKNSPCRIEYKAVTYFGTTVTLGSFNVQITETVAPEIIVSKAPVAKAKLGSEVKLYTATATDAVSGTGTLFNAGEATPSGTVVKLFVFDPNLSKHQVFADNLSFKANMKGVWRVVYYAYDECYNVSRVEYKVVVE